MMAGLFLSACGTYSTSSVTPPSVAAGRSLSPEVPVVKTADQVIVTENDIANRPYVSLGDISVTVRKVTIFDSDPTREKVAQALKEKAAALGADAVVLVRYGTVGVGAFSWGQMDGEGRAIAFRK
jgi:hypothetical protein